MIPYLMLEVLMQPQTVVVMEERAVVRVVAEIKQVVEVRLLKESLAA